MKDKQLDLHLGRIGRDDALDLLERTRREWIASARDFALGVAKNSGSVCADDIHRLCPIPEGVDRRVMGAVFMIPELVTAGFVQTKRPEAHARPIRRFVLNEDIPVV